jgi:tRNA threonylcarbamoyladenosine biosynthesis protein TsaE
MEPASPSRRGATNIGWTKGIQGMTEFRFDAADIDDTERLGKALAAELPAGTVVALLGTLGAGKTRLVQATAAALNVDREQVVSPTFVLLQQYAGKRPIYHLDAYRLHDDDEFLQLGPEEFFDGGGLTFIEWADKVERCLPAEHLTIEIEVTGATSRVFIIRAIGPELEAAVRNVQQHLTKG